MEFVKGGKGFTKLVGFLSLPKIAVIGKKISYKYAFGYSGGGPDSNIKYEDLDLPYNSSGVVNRVLQGMLSKIDQF